MRLCNICIYSRNGFVLFTTYHFRYFSLHGMVSTILMASTSRSFLRCEFRKFTFMSTTFPFYNCINSMKGISPPELQSTLVTTVLIPSAKYEYETPQNRNKTVPQLHLFRSANVYSGSYSFDRASKHSLVLYYKQSNDVSGFYLNDNLKLISFIRDLVQLFKIFQKRIQAEDSNVISLHHSMISARRPLAAVNSYSNLFKKFAGITSCTSLVW